MFTPNTKHVGRRLNGELGEEVPFGGEEVVEVAQVCEVEDEALQAEEHPEEDEPHPDLPLVLFLLYQ